MKLNMKETKKKNGFSLTDEQFEKIKKVMETFYIRFEKEMLYLLKLLHKGILIFL